MKLKKVRITPEIKLYYCNHEPDWGLVNKASQIFDGFVVPFKTKNRHQVYLLEHNSEIYYAKKFSPPTFEQKLSYRFRQSKALTCFNISNQLRAINLKVVESVFVLNYQKNWEHESILVTRKSDGTNLKEFFNSDVVSSEKETVFKCLVSTLGAFYKNGFLHFDPILTNFFIDPNQKPYKIMFLDFDSISHTNWVSTKRTFYVLSKFFYFCYTFLANQSKDKLYTREQLLFYLNVFLKSYDPLIKVEEAYKLLTQGTCKLLKRKNKLSVKNKVVLSKMIAQQSNK